MPWLYLHYITAYEAALEKFQKQFARNATARILIGVCLVFFHLDGLPVCFQAQFKLLVMTFKSLYGLGTTCLNDHLLSYEPTLSPVVILRGLALDALDFLD